MTGKTICIDYETTGLNPYAGHHWFSYSLTNIVDGATDVYYGRTVSNTNRLKDFWADTSIEKVAHNLKYELSMTTQAGIEVPSNSILHDTMIQAKLLDNSLLGYGLDDLTEKYFSYHTPYDKQIADWAKRVPNYQHIPKGLMIKYQKQDGIRTALLHNLFFPEIQKNEKIFADYRNEILLLETTRRMEAFGVLIDHEQIAEMVKEYEGILNEINYQIATFFGEFINLNSGAEVANLLFKRLSMVSLKRTKKGSPSVDKDALFKLLESELTKIQKDIIHDILKYRAYSKGASMLAGYQDLAGKDNILHPSINTNGATTGRQSCCNPNLQNVSKELSLKTMYTVPARKAFIARPNSLLLFADYAGIEMRLIVDAVRQPEMLAGLMRGGHGEDDPHVMAAHTLFADRYSDERESFKWYMQDVINERKFKAFLKIHGKEDAYKEFARIARKVLRDGAKGGNFAIAYGAGQEKVEFSLNMKRGELAEGFTRYANKFPEIRFYTRSVIEEVQKTGGILTAFGRFLRVPADMAYIAANYKIQGTAAGIMKRAEVNVDNYLINNFDDLIRMILTIHDEIVFHYPRIFIPKMKEIITGINLQMVTMKEIIVPLEIEWKMSNYSWDTAKGINLETL